jgi:hypothetical protein
VSSCSLHPKYEKRISVNRSIPRRPPGRCAPTVRGAPRGLGLAVLALLLVPRAGGAHAPGISLADFEVHANGQVEAQLTFSSAEPLGGLALDRDHDGTVTADDVRAAQGDLRALWLQGVEVLADGSPCAPAFRDALLTDLDGLVLRGGFTCPSDASEVEVTLYYLSELPPGPGHGPHKTIARIIAGSMVIEEVLTGEHRAIALRLPSGGGAATREPKRLVALAIAAIVIGLLAAGARRWRSVRAAWQNRRS